MSRFPLLPRPKRSDKSRYGHVLIAGGCDAMPGAAALAARAALESGSGLVTMASTRRATAAGVTRTPDLITLPLSACEGSVRGSSAEAVLRYAAKRRVSAAVLGPGLSTAPSARIFVRKLFRSFRIPFVLDADGLNAFAGRADELKKRRAPVVLTPHAREFGRLFGQKPPEGGKERTRLAKAVAGDYSIILLLKGHRTVVTDGRRLYVNRTGNPGMAKGGSGDVLAGMIAAFLAQGMKPFEAAAWGAYLHGKAGDRLAKRTSELSVTASGLLAELPAVFREAQKTRLSLG